MGSEDGFSESKKNEKWEVEDDDEATEFPEKTAPLEATGAGINGDSILEVLHLETGIRTKMVEEGDEIGMGIRASKSSPKATSENGYAIIETEKAMEESPPEPTGSPAAIKGYGLKKWRRKIRPDASKDGGADACSDRILKRGLSNAEPAETHNEYDKKDREGESSVASVDLGGVGSVLHSPAEAAPGRGVLDPELELLVAGAGFSIGMDSDNSEDWGSKSATVASALKLKHDGFGSGRGRNQVKNSGGKGLGYHRRGSGIDISKKLRGGQVGLEKEILHSSLETDMRSSNAMFVQWGMADSDGRQRERSLSCDGENGDEVQIGEEVQDDCFKDNGEELKDMSRENLCPDESVKNKREDSESPQCGEDGDPLAKSIILLQAAEESLEKEIQKFGEIGKEAHSVPNYSHDQFSLEEEKEGSIPPHLEDKVTQLSQKVELLQRELNEALAAAQEKELKVIELEGILNEINQLPKRETEGSGLLQERSKELELEILFRRKIEAEIEYMMLTGMVQESKVTPKDPSALLKEQKSLAEEINVKLKDAENKAISLKRRAEELELSCEELLGTGKILKLQNRVCKFSLCFFIQLVMLFIAFGFSLMRLLPSPSEVVPT